MKKVIGYLRGVWYIVTHFREIYSQVQKQRAMAEAMRNLALAMDKHIKRS